ncbi:MAG: transposase [Bacillota bacterium]
MYDHEAIVTNLDDMPPEEVWRWYNKRANVENKIDELKTGLGLDQNSQHAMVKNRAFIWIKILAYNLLNWFRQALLPENAARAEVSTIRRLVVNVPANIVDNGRLPAHQDGGEPLVGAGHRPYQGQTAGVHRDQGLAECAAGLTGPAPDK